MKRLAIITTHPIQYNAPWFAMLAKEPDVELKVFYTWSQRQTDLFDEKFGKAIEWDIPLLEGYDYTFVENVSKKPGTKSFWGIKCPTLINEILTYSPTHLLIFGWNFQAHFKVMRHFKGKIPVWFRGDSTLLDYEVKSIKELMSSIKNQGWKEKKNFGVNKKKKYKKTLTSHFSLLTTYIKYKLRITFLSYIYKQIDTALYVGQANKAYFKACGLKKSRLKFVPHAIDNDRFKDSDTQRYKEKAQQWRTKMGIQPKDIVILFAGKFESKKNPLQLLNAFNTLNNQNINKSIHFGSDDNQHTEVSSNTQILKSPNPQIQTSKHLNLHLHLIFTGSGPLEEQLKSQSKNLPNIHFLPFQNQSQMPVVYRLANIFCLPSQGPGETWGLAVNEAMACDIPVIVSDKVGCALDLTISPNKVFKCGDDSDLSNKLIEMIYSIKSNETNKKQLYEIINNWSFKTIINTIKCIL
ncbi:MAG: glycosyltransferase family 4 protein [Marinilabiliaceae bacterium]|nr:glycosyltransferase family 4 protein [Marinilabiliaceae bacterium]